MVAVVFSYWIKLSAAALSQRMVIAHHRLFETGVVSPPASDGLAATLKFFCPGKSDRRDVRRLGGGAFLEF